MRTIWTHLHQFHNDSLWTGSICGKVLEKVQTEQKFELCQIIIQAIPVKKCAAEIWTKQFEQKLRGIIKRLDFNSRGAELILQIVEAAIYNNICDVMIVSDFSSAVQSKNADIRFTSLKLIADACSQPKLQPELVTFVVSSIFPQMEQLMSDEVIIADCTLRILSAVANADRSVVSKLSDNAKLSLIFKRVADNASASALACLIVQSNEITIDVLVKAGLLDAIKDSMSKLGNLGAFDLLHSVIYPIARQLHERRDSEQIQDAIRLISPLVELSQKCVEMIPDAPRASSCLCLLIHIFPDRLPPKCIDAFGQCHLIPELKKY